MIGYMPDMVQAVVSSNTIYKNNASLNGDGNGAILNECSDEVQTTALIPTEAESINDSDFIIENGILKEYLGDGGNVVLPEDVAVSVWCPNPDQRIQR